MGGAGPADTAKARELIGPLIDAGATWWDERQLQSSDDLDRLAPVPMRPYLRLARLDRQERNALDPEEGACLVHEPLAHGAGRLLCGGDGQQPRDGLHGLAAVEVDSRRRRREIQKVLVAEDLALAG